MASGGSGSVGIGLRQPHYDAMLRQPPRLGFVELHSENFVADGGAALAVLHAARVHWPVSLHGVGLSLGSAAGLDDWHLDRLERLVRRCLQKDADDRWLERARRANSLAAGLAGRLQAIPGVTLVAPVEVDMLFLRIPPAAIAALDDGPFRYSELGRDVRLVCRPDQEPEGMVALVECLQRALREKA